MNPADKAQIEQAKFYASQSYKEAGDVMGRAGRTTRDFVDQADQAMSQIVATIGASGNLAWTGTGHDAGRIPGTGVDPGESPEVKLEGLRGSIDDLTTRIAALRAKTVTQSGGPDGDPQVVADPVAQKEANQLQEKLNLQKKQADLLGQIEGVEDVQLNQAASLATGSTLLALNTTRDKLNRQRNEYLSDVYREAEKLLEAGEHWTGQADLARQAAAWNTVGTILGLAREGVQMAATLGFM